jgi:hypothetical protein
VLDIAHLIESMHLHDGDVVVDNFSACIPEAITNSSDPKVFIIPNDRDFPRVLADPLTFHAGYILVPEPVGNNTLAATTRAYPTLYQNGDGFAKLVTSIPNRGLCPAFRLYRVVGHPPFSA